MPLPSTLCRHGHARWTIRTKQHPQLLETFLALRTFTTASASASTEQRPRPFRFVVGASWLGKPPGPKPRRSRYLPAVYPFDPKSPIGAWRDKTLEWPKGVLPANKDPGHDFFYIQPMMNNSGLSVGVADGVGGWDDVTNPALFSQALMYHCHRYSKRGWAGEPETDPTQGYEEREAIEGWELTPAQCLENAHTAVLREKSVVAGSSTATVLNFNASSGLLRTLNLGDSGFIIVRSSNIIYESVYQTHYFNCPMQLSKIPPSFEGPFRDQVSDGHPFEMRLRDGDLVVAYTDGLCDNVFGSEMLALCTLAGRIGGTDEEQVQAVTDNFVHYARACMINDHRSGPWAQRSTRAGMPFEGGRYRCGCSRSRSIGFTVDTSPLIQSAHIRLGSGSNPTIAQAGNLSSYHITGMKDLHSDANFPRTGDGRVYHLGIKTGEVANRIVAVGSPSRALVIAEHLDKTPVPFKLTSERGFMTITGRYKGVPISIVSTGMGFPNTDFFVREVRESLSGDMLVVRLGSCGALIDISPGSLVVPKACVGINRNWDYDFINGDPTQQPYSITKQVDADPEIYEAVYKSLEAARPEGKTTKIVNGLVNASADSFYSSQGRQTSFPDRNEYLIPHLLESVPDIGSFEMETFHLYHLAKNYVPLRRRPLGDAQPPVAAGPVSPAVESITESTQSKVPDQTAASPPRIRAAAAQMIFAARLSKAFITPDDVVELERWSGRGILEALIGINLPADRCHEEAGSVWEFK